MNFVNWLLKPERTTSGKVRNVFLMFLAFVVWMGFLSLFLPMFVTTWHFHPIRALDIPKHFPSWADIFFSVLMAPLWEELAFRVAPYRVAQNMGKQYLVPIMIFSCILFGWGHGNGSISLLMQGMMGLGFTVIYLKNNYSYWSSVAVHAMWNTFCYFIIS